MANLKKLVTSKVTSHLEKLAKDEPEIYAKFWIETTNMGPNDVAKQIQQSGMVMVG
jgi:HSP90 family molecular chaperone